MVSIPFGSYDRRILNRLKKEGWNIIFTSDRGTADFEARIKSRETLKAEMQNRNILRELLEEPRLYVRFKRTLSRFHKQFR
jgi:hypothetical protein